MTTTQFNLLSGDAVTSASVQLERLDAEHYAVTVNDMAMDLTLTVMERYPSALKGTLFAREKAYPFAAAFLKGDAEKQPIQVWLEGQTFWLEKINPQSRRSHGKHGAAAFGNIKAPMPGTVLKVLVEEGQQVEAKQSVVIMESMKMEMTLSAPAACVITKIAVAANQLVAMQETLVEIQPVE